MAFECDYCGKTFSTKQRLDYHLEKNVCNKGEETMNQETDESNVSPVYLFKEQRENAGNEEKTVYICGGCGHRSETKFTTCSACGVENEF